MKVRSFHKNLYSTLLAPSKNRTFSARRWPPRPIVLTTFRASIESLSKSSSFIALITSLSLFSSSFFTFCFNFEFSSSNFEISFSASRSLESDFTIKFGKFSSFNFEIFWRLFQIWNRCSWFGSYSRSGLRQTVWHSAWQDPSNLLVSGIAATSKVISSAFGKVTVDRFEHEQKQFVSILTDFLRNSMDFIFLIFENEWSRISFNDGWRTSLSGPGM